MNQKTIRIIGACAAIGLWAVLTAFCWFGPRAEFSYTERSQLSQAPELSGEAVIDGSFMKDFEEFSLDQFPLRDAFRSLKAVFHLYGLGQADNNGLFQQDGYLEQMEMTVDQSAIDRTAGIFNSVYQNLLSGKTDKIYFTLIPDKGWYLDHPTTDLNVMEQALLEQIDWAEYVDIKDSLTIEDYYFTDTHWRQEKILKVAQKLCEAMGSTANADYVITELARPFYGVYYGQAALPVPPEKLYIMENDILSGCKVYSYKQGPVSDPPQIGIYNTEQADSMVEPYDVFLYGSNETYLVIENPNAATDKELVIFRDSFGCSLTPLMIQDYAKVTVIDLRRVGPMALSFFENRGVLNLEGADVLFAYSALVINNPTSFQAN